MAIEYARYRLRAVALIALAIGVVLIGSAWSIEATTRSGPPMFFSIPAQPLANALQVFGEVAGIQVLYESKSAVGRKSPAIEGFYPPNEALRLLLAGTDLKVHYNQPDAVTLAPEADDVAAHPHSFPASDLMLGTLHVHEGIAAAPPIGEYSERVRMDLQNALQKNLRTRQGNYRAALDVWINSARVVVRVDISDSTGDRERDAALISALRGVIISGPAPPNAPRPVRVGVSVRST